MTPPPFVLFGPQHLTALQVIALLCVVFSLPGRRWERPTSWFLACLLLSYVVIAYVTLRHTGNLSLRYDLPLEICDLEVIFCVWCLLSGRQLIFEICYYWGLAGTLQALITPDLRVGFPSWWFVQFFVAHGLVVIVIVYLIAARTLRPRTGAMWRALAALNVYVIVVGLLDWRCGWNYGYLCHPPAAASIASYLGPWPWYVVGCECIAVLLFALLELPWRLSPWRQ